MMQLNRSSENIYTDTTCDIMTKIHVNTYRVVQKVSRCSGLFFGPGCIKTVTDDKNKQLNKDSMATSE